MEDASSSRRARASEKEKSLPRGGFTQAVDAISQTTRGASYADAEAGRAPYTRKGSVRSVGLSTTHVLFKEAT